MGTTLAEAKAEALGMLRASDYARALRAYDQILAAQPLDHEVRLKIADLLGKAGLEEEAAEVYRAVALHDVRTGHPLAAVVACHALAALGRPAEDILALVAESYASGSPQLARFAVRPAPADPRTPVAAWDPLAGEPFDKVADRSRRRALDLSAFAGQELQFHPLPFFSELGPQPLMAVLRSLKVHRLGDGAVVTRQGDPGTALYLVASGDVRVTTKAADGVEREVARLHENTLFGEMALITNQPRSASVTVVDEADVIEVSREALVRVTAQIPAIKEVLDRFTRERLIKNLLQSSPLFTPFSRQQQSDLLRRFEGHDVEAGSDVIREGEPGVGLFVVLSGELEVVTSRAGAAPVILARLGPGDIFGEMSLVTQQPASATVRARTRAMLLFLSRTYVERLAAAIPEVSAYFGQVAARRALDNTVVLTRFGVPAAAIELDDSDVVLL